MPKFRIVETIHQEKIHTVRLGTVAAPLTDNDIGKPVKLIGESAYGLCADGDAIEGFLQSVNAATQDGFKIGGICKTGYKNVTGSTALAIGDYIVAGANPARGVKLTGPMIVKKAAAAAAAGYFAPRVVSLGDLGTGAAGTTVCADFN